MSNLLRTIRTQAWMIDPSVIDAYAPSVLRMIQGKNVDFNQPVVDNRTIEVEKQTPGGTTVVEKVAVLPIRGVIMKANQECGPRGLESKAADLRCYLNDPSIKAVIIDLDTPGGQASFLDTFSQIISSAKKPVLAYYNSMCASAGYFIGSSCHKIYASEKTDVVGSIGTLFSFMDLKGFYEKQGAKIHEVYADQSTEKNKVFRDAMENNYEGLKQNLLNPFAQSFINHVKSNRDGIDEKVFKGATYMSEEAIELGLIDGIKSFGEVVEEALLLADSEDFSNNQISKNQSIMNKKILAVAAFLGLETLESKDGHISLSVENVEKIGAKLSEESAGSEGPKETKEEPGDDSNSSDKRIDALEEKVGSFDNKLSDVSKQLTDLSNTLTTAITGKGANPETVAVNSEKETHEEGEFKMEAPTEDDL